MYASHNTLPSAKDFLKYYRIPRLFILYFRAGGETGNKESNNCFPFLLIENQIFRKIYKKIENYVIEKEWIQVKVLLLAGGFGTRLSEETDTRPKPMVEVGGKPILWHIMKIYSHYGYNDFVVLLGYKGYSIKEYFSNYFLHQSDVTINIRTGKMEIHNNTSEPWKVTLLDTGLESMTGGRIKRAQRLIGNKPFMVTYGDGVD